MIAIIKDFKNPPASLLKKKCLDTIEHCIKESKYIDSTWYKKEDTKEQLDTIYKQKCAYCEGHSQAQAPFQVEHYRPKNTPKENENHPGYYWLAYEWSNLLWSCFWCNNYKDNQFPLVEEKNRVVEHPANLSGKLDVDQCKIDSNKLINEQALLLNPETDNPNEHLYFSTNGTITSNSKRGEETIRICKLNRKELVLDRKKILDDFRDDIGYEVKAFLKDKIDFKSFKHNIKTQISKISKSGLKHKVYSRFGYFMFIEFEKFFVDNLVYDENTKIILLEIYNEFKTEFLT